MSVTPQTNTDLKHVAEALAGQDDIVVCGHVSPDGDCIGSQLALAHALRGLGKRVTCVLARDEPIDVHLSFLPGAGRLVPAASYEGPVGAFVAVDVPLRDRMGAAVSLLDRCSLSVTLDHHACDTTMTELVYVDPQAASTTTLIWELVGLMGVHPSADVALCCYTGLVTDTGRFQYQNTDASALRAAAAMVVAGADPSAVSRAIFQNRSLASIQLEGVAIDRMRIGAQGSFVISWLTRDDFSRYSATKADAEPLVDTLRSLRGVRLACMLRDQGDAVRGSFRAKDDTDVARLARSLGGGGHRAAAGFTVSGPIEAAVERIDALLSRELCATEEGVRAE